MNKNNFLQAATTFRTEVLALACFAEKMTTIVNFEEHTDKEGNTTQKEVFLHKEAGEKLLKTCKDLFKKGEAHVNAMFKADNKTKYSELNFSDHLDVMRDRVLTHRDQEKNIPLMESLFEKMKISVRNFEPKMVHFDSGAKWTPTSYDEKRQLSMVKAVDEIEKVLS